MSVSHNDFTIHSGLTSDVLLAQAQQYSVSEYRRMTLALHQVPSTGNTFKADVTIYGSVKDDVNWFTEITTKSLSTASETIDHIDIATIYPGRVLRYLKIVISNVSDGYLDIHLATSRY